MRVVTRIPMAELQNHLPVKHKLLIVSTTMLAFKAEHTLTLRITGLHIFYGD